MRPARTLARPVPVLARPAVPPRPATRGRRGPAGGGDWVDGEGAGEGRGGEEALEEAAGAEGDDEVRAAGPQEPVRLADELAENGGEGCGMKGADVAARREEGGQRTSKGAARRHGGQIGGKWIERGA